MRITVRKSDLVHITRSNHHVWGHVQIYHFLYLNISRRIINIYTAIVIIIKDIGTTYNVSKQSSFWNQELDKNMIIHTYYQCYILIWTSMHYASLSTLASYDYWYLCVIKNKWAVHSWLLFISLVKILQYHNNLY